MRSTVVVLSLRVPVLAVRLRESEVLDQLSETWRATKGVKSVQADWKYLPVACTEAASVDVSVTIEAETSKGLQRIYNNLSREASREPGRLASRTCNLTEMFE